MKSHFTISKFPLYFLSLLVVTTTMISCATTQTVSGNDDGIYADDTERPTRKVVQTNEREYNEYNENYFTKEVERLDKINGTDIITDIDSYRSDEYDFDDEIIEQDENQGQISSNREPWGFDSDSDVVVNINTFGNGFGWGFDPYWNSWNNPYWGWRGRFGNRWGWNYNPYWHPYHGPNYWNNGFYVGIGGFYDPFYCPPGFYGYNRFGIYNGYRSFRNRGYSRYGYRNGLYSRRGRGTYAYNNRRAYSRRNSRSASRRSSRVYRRNNSGVNRTNRSISRNRNGNSSVRRNSRGISRSSGSRATNRRSGSVRRNRSSSSNRSRSYNNSSRSNNRSYTPSRSSSRSRSFSRSSSSRSRGSSSRGSRRRR